PRPGPSPARTGPWPGPAWGSCPGGPAADPSPVVTRARLGVIARLPEPIGIHVQAWRRALGDPAAERIVPHPTLVPPQTVAERDLDRAVALLERAAADAVPFLVELDGAATFLPGSPVAYLVVREGGPALQALEVALQASPLDRRTHPFRAHVTVAQDLPDERIEAAARELAGFRATFPVREVSLMREDRDKVWRGGAPPAAPGAP